MFGAVRLLFGTHVAAGGWEVFRVRDEAAGLPVQLAEALFRGAAAVEARGVDLVVPVGLEDLKEGGGRRGGVHAGLFDVWVGRGC